MAFIDNVKQWFKTGDFPDQPQFYQKFAWLRWKDEPIAISEVTELQDILNNINGAVGGVKQFASLSGNGYVQVPAACEIRKIILYAADTNEVVNVGITELGAEIEGQITLIGGTKYRIIQNFDLPENGRIYFSGVTSLINIVIYKD
jgi:hypothetical protein